MKTYTPEFKAVVVMSDTVRHNDITESFHITEKNHQLRDQRKIELIGSSVNGSANHTVLYQQDFARLMAYADPKVLGNDYTGIYLRTNLTDDVPMSAKFLERFVKDVAPVYGERLVEITPRSVLSSVQDPLGERQAYEIEGHPPRLLVSVKVKSFLCFKWSVVKVLNCTKSLKEYIAKYDDFEVHYLTPIIKASEIELPVRLKPLINMIDSARVVAWHPEPQWIIESNPD